MNASQFLAVAENAARYRTWLNDPITQIVLDIVDREQIIDVPPDNVLRAELALTRLGIYDGKCRCLRRIRSLDEPARVEIPEPVADYGATRVMSPAELAAMQRMMEKSKGNSNV